ncbi:hypothetical protein [Methanocella sp. MCL-LM]|uniref:hypothetical protein n=1 Tax=Methanocella sp. MCL-LM TaxID=3412035 RepID=UPI003C73CF3E
MDKNTKYLIIGCIGIVIILLLGLAYMQGTQNNTPAPTATPAPAATATATATSVPVVASVGNSTVTPTATPAATPTATIEPTVAPTATPTPTAQAAVSPTPVIHGWPYYNKQYGPAVEQKNTGTITVHLENMLGNPISIGEAGVLEGSGVPEELWADDETTLPTTYVEIGEDGSASLGEFDYGTYTVYYHAGGDLYMTRSLVISDDHRDWDVTFTLMPA